MVAHHLASPGSSSPVSVLQRSLRQSSVVTRFDLALRNWSREDPDLSGIESAQCLSAVLATREYARHDEVLFALLRRAATLGSDGVTAAEIVLNAMLPAVPGITGRVIRASRTAAGAFGPRRGVTGGGVSASEDNADIQATVIGHLWEQVRCYPLRRCHHVAANLVRETQRAALRALGVDYAQAVADVVSIDVDDFHGGVTQSTAEVDASEELLELLAWAVEQKRLDEQASAILVARYFGDRVGRDGVATDRQVGELFGVSQPTVTRRRNRAVEQLAEAAREFPGCGIRWAS
ncbi:hypothetical protein QRX50_20190 [Amycolatopsis carbonis]|uniref:Uncharacterized protein n=1 Tax=Amycolatopsis carbonis TaxID=715471 RepID=A0A9Y2IQZ8_9PSEU|nr:hypothetical protein [Amycolatopsis sp. 2-15]WIX82918.1 hypothetical protein QRX50_20190 [Amycolatopsis sp. 2-15]